MRIRAIPATIAALTLISCHPLVPHAPLREREGRSEKFWSDRSYADRTDVRRTPSPAPFSPGWDSERVLSGEDDWEPALAVDPLAPFVYQVSTRHVRSVSGSRIVFRRSRDGGATWDPEQFLDTVDQYQWDPRIEVSRDGTVFLTYAVFSGNPLYFLKSADHGDSWSTPVNLVPAGSRADFPLLVVSADGRDVYVAYNWWYSYVVASHDGGATFSAPVRTDDGSRELWYHYAGVVMPDGTVHIATVDFGPDLDEGQGEIQLLSSRDGGASWTTTLVDTSEAAPDCSGPISPCPRGDVPAGFFGPGPALAADSTGLLLIAYNLATVPFSSEAIYVRSSPDGRSFSPRRSVSPVSPHVNCAFAQVAAGPIPGEFRIAWQDDRNGPWYRWNTYHRRSKDGGLTWGAVGRLSDLGSGAPYKEADGYYLPYGDYLEIGVDGQGATHAAWGEGDSFGGPGGTWYTRGACADGGPAPDLGNGLGAVKAGEAREAVRLDWQPAGGAAYVVYRDAAGDFRSPALLIDTPDRFALDWPEPAETWYYRARSLDCDGGEGP